MTWWLELPPDYSGRFENFQVLAATMRFVLRGTPREETVHFEFSFPGAAIYLPEFYLKRIKWWEEQW